MTPPRKPATANAAEPRFQPHPDDLVELQEATAEVDRGELLSAEDSEAVICWLESSSEGPCPVPFVDPD